MNWSTFSDKLVTMLGMSDKDVTPEQLLDQLATIVQSNTAVIESAAELSGIESSLAQLSSDVGSLKDVLANHKETLEEVVTGTASNSLRIEEIAKSVVSKTAIAENIKTLTVNRDKVTTETEEDDDQQDITLDTNLMLKAKNKTSWPKL